MVDIAARRAVPAIVSLRTFPIRIPFVDGGQRQRRHAGRRHMPDMVLIRVEDEDEHVGSGEAFAYFALKR
jgi:L-alanine-DL-glutamate epimerase-like enolase superfamily enzyme